jgi:hypothetical protein
VNKMASRFAVATWILGLCLTISSASSAATIATFQAILSGDNEVPPVVTNKTGTARFTLTDDGGQLQLSYEVETFGFDIGGINTEDPNDDITGMHIHNGPAGATGPVVFGMFRPKHDVDNRIITINGGTGFIRFEGAWDDADVATGSQSLASQLDSLMNGGLYLNVHTPVNPGGEIRGQIVPEPSSMVLAAAALALLVLAVRRRV